MGRGAANPSEGVPLDVQGTRFRAWVSLRAERGAGARVRGLRASPAHWGDVRWCAHRSPCAPGWVAGTGALASSAPPVVEVGSKICLRIAATTPAGEPAKPRGEPERVSVGPLAGVPPWQSGGDGSTTVRLSRASLHQRDLLPEPYADPCPTRSRGPLRRPALGAGRSRSFDTVRWVGRPSCGRPSGSWERGVMLHFLAVATPTVRAKGQDRACRSSKRAQSAPVR